MVTGSFFFSKQNSGDVWTVVMMMMMMMMMMVQKMMTMLMIAMVTACSTHLFDFCLETDSNVFTVFDNNFIRRTFIVHDDRYEGT